MECTACKENRTEQEFSYKNKKIGKRSTICKICLRKYAKNHYLENKDKYIAKAKVGNKQYLRRSRQHVLDYLEQHPCVDCGESNPVVLEFDHVRGKKYKAISAMITANASVKRIEREIKKCDVRCANCHKIKTAKDGNFFRFRNKTLDPLVGSNPPLGI